MNRQKHYRKAMVLFCVVSLCEHPRLVLVLFMLFLYLRLRLFLYLSFYGFSIFNLPMPTTPFLCRSAVGSRHGTNHATALLATAHYAHLLVLKEEVEGQAGAGQKVLQAAQGTHLGLRGNSATLTNVACQSRRSASSASKSIASPCHRKPRKAQAKSPGPLEGRWK